MTDDEIQKIYDGMREEFSSLPDPVHEPLRFQFYVKWYKYLASQKTKEPPSNK